mmetsp:Transcript_4720/g.17840  ORF Transcript_4720/g.17840 Transcript_4720/m.17840 type:complete len:261 (-) Transcript_4720:58-840(-)
MLGAQLLHGHAKSDAVHDPERAGGADRHRRRAVHFVEHGQLAKGVFRPELLELSVINGDREDTRLNDVAAIPGVALSENHVARVHLVLSHVRDDHVDLLILETLEEEVLLQHLFQEVLVLWAHDRGRDGMWPRLRRITRDRFLLSADSLELLVRTSPLRRVLPTGPCAGLGAGADDADVAQRGPLGGQLVLHKWIASAGAGLILRLRLTLRLQLRRRRSGPRVGCWHHLAVAEILAGRSHLLGSDRLTTVAPHGCANAIA